MRHANRYPITSLSVDTPQLLNPSMLVLRAFRRYRAELRTIAGVAALYALTSIGTTIVAGAIALAGLIALRGNTIVLVIGGMALLVFAVLAFVWIISVFSLAFVEIAAATEPLSMWQALDRGWQGARSYLWLISIQAVFVASGYVLLIVPGVIFGILASVAAFTFVVEGKRGVAAIARSWSYVSGRKWAILWRVGAYGVLLVLGFLAARIVVLLISRYTGSVTTFALSEVVTLGFDFFIAVPLSTLFMGELYRSLRESRPVPSGGDTRESDRRGVIIGFSLFGALVLATYLALLMLGGALLVIAALHLAK